MFMRLHCDCICLKTVESVADFNQFWQSFQGYPTFASSVNIRYLNRVKRDTFNTLMREEGEIRKERQDQKEKRRQRKALVLLDVSIFAARCRPWCIHCLPCPYSWHQVTQPARCSSKAAPGLHTLPSTVTVSSTKTPGPSALGFPVHGLPWTGEKLKHGKSGSWKKTHLTFSCRSWLLLALQQVVTALSWVFVCNWASTSRSLSSPQSCPKAINFWE